MKKLSSIICSLAILFCVSCGGANNSSNTNENSTEKQENTPSTTNDKPAQESKTEAQESATPDLTKKYICPNRDFSSDDANAVCPVCGMDGFIENN